MADKFDVAVIGGGPGGYVAAIRAAQLGMKVCVVEMDKMGGICLNWGCIPTKALLQSAHTLEHIKHASEFGISVKDIKTDFPAVIKRSRGVADQMSKGVSFLMKKNNITVIAGKAVFKDKNTISVQDSKGNETGEVSADNFIVATGARSKPLPGTPFDGNIILSSKEAMIQEDAPKTLAVIGAGAIGIEFSDFYASMGTKVHIIEYLDHLLPNEDEEISKILERTFKKRAIDFTTGAMVIEVKTTKTGATLKIQDKKDTTKITELKVDKVIVGIGLSPNTENMKLEEIGIKLDKGFIHVNNRYQTTVDTIYAIGDVTGPPLLAHVASMEGIKAAEAISITKGNHHNLDYQPINYDFIPGCTYCHPEVASVGMTEKKAIATGHKIKVGRFPYTASGRAQAQGETTGMFKIIADAEHGEILGGHIIGAGATEMISEINLGANMELTAKDLMNTIHAHPTLSEGVMEAAADVYGEAINT